MKRVKEPKKFSFNKKNLFWIVPIFLLFIFFIYTSFFKTTSTGDDHVFLNRTEYLRNLSGNETSVEEPLISNPVPLPPPSSPPKTPSSGGSSGGASPENPVETPNEILPEITAFDSDYSEFDGKNYTDNFFKKGTCEDSENEKGLTDFCTQEEVTEYYIEENSCKSTTMNCSSLINYYKTNTQAGCYNGMCVIKAGGKNLTQQDQVVINEIVYWDECNENGLLMEWFLTVEGVPTYTFINCSQTLGSDYKCLEGACEQVAFDSDAMDFYNFGNCYLKGSIYFDSCTEYGSLIEYIVDPNEPTKCKEVDTYCPTGICSSGRCIVVDYDANLQSPYETKSSCTQTFERNVTDSCRCLNDGNTCTYLTEWVVQDNSCVDKIIDCRTALSNENAYCADGKCIAGRTYR